MWVNYLRLEYLPPFIRAQPAGRTMLVLPDWCGGTDFPCHPDQRALIWAAVLQKEKDAAEYKKPFKGKEQEHLLTFCE